MRVKTFCDYAGLITREIEEWMGSGDKMSIKEVEAFFGPMPKSDTWPQVFVVIYYELHPD